MNWLAIAALNMALAVMTGAFGAHALKERLSTEALGWWQTAVAYQMWHALGLVALGVLLRMSLRSPGIARGWCSNIRRGTVTAGHCDFFRQPVRHGVGFAALVWGDYADRRAGLYRGLFMAGLQPHAECVR